MRLPSGSRAAARAAAVADAAPGPLPLPGRGRALGGGHHQPAPGAATPGGESHRGGVARSFEAFCLDVRTLTFCQLMGFPY